MPDVTLYHGNPRMIDYTPGAGDVQAGQVVLLGNLTGITCGIATELIKNNAKGALAVGGAVWSGTNLNNAANYAKVYWDNSAKKFTTVSTNNAQFGYVSQDGGGNANTTCRVLHDPFV